VWSGKCRTQTHRRMVWIHRGTAPRLPSEALPDGETLSGDYPSRAGKYYRSCYHRSLASEG
jgi:hypothetical protein